MQLIQKKKTKEKITLGIEGELTIYSVKDLNNALSDYFGSEKNLEFDMSKISKIDTAGFQLIEMIRREIKNSGRNVLFFNPSAEVAGIYNLFGEEL